MNPSRKKTKNSFEKFFTVLWHTLVVYDIWIFIIIFSYSHLISHITIFNKHTVPPFSTLNSIRPTHLIKKEKLRAESSAWSGSFYDIFLIFFSLIHSVAIYIWCDEMRRIEKECLWMWMYDEEDASVVGYVWRDGKLFCVLRPNASSRARVNVNKENKYGSVKNFSFFSIFFLF